MPVGFPKQRAGASLAAGYPLFLASGACWRTCFGLWHERFGTGEKMMMTMTNGKWPLLGPAVAASLLVLGGCSAGDSERIEQLEARLQAAEDHIAIEQLLMDYAAAFNTGNADAYAATFAPGGTLELLRNVGEPPFAGPYDTDALREQFFADVAPDNDIRRFGPMRHVTTNAEISIEGDTATVRAFFIEIVSNGLNSPSGTNPPTIYQMGRYEDDLVKLDGRWLFSKRRVITDMNTVFPREQ